MARSSNLEDLLERLNGDQSVKDGIRDMMRFGLVYEDSREEVLRLVGGKVTTGSRVDDSSPAIDRFGSVVRAPRDVTLDKGARAVSWDDSPGKVDYVAENSLVAIAKPGETVYSGLNVIDEVRRGGDKPAHLVIQGENLHALQTLRYTHTGKVDVAYLDPPYNSGGDLVYNDHYVAKEDAFRHSKWLSFMDKRLRVAKELLSDTGVIIVAIDDNEQAHLRLLMDEIFGAQNFISMVVWQGVPQNNVRFTGGGADYMLVYARNVSALVNCDATWTETRPGAVDVLGAANRIWLSSEGDKELATKSLRAWFGSLPESHPARANGNYNYNNFDAAGRVFQATNMGGIALRPNLQYDLLHPVTGKPVRMPPYGWRYSRETMDRMLSEDRVFFGVDETTLAYYKKFLDEDGGSNPPTTFSMSRRTATHALEKILGGKRFMYPKDTNVLARWIGIVTSNNSNAVVLDFFGGSGSTMHAVMEMNAADGGSRQCILVTNNEVEEKQRKALVKDGYFPGDPEFEKHGIFHHVTYPRIKTVATGIREDGTTYSEGLAENVVFAELTYTHPSTVRLGRDFDAIAPLLWARAGGRGEIITNPAGAEFCVGDNYAIAFSAGATTVTEFSAALVAADLPEGTDVFVVSDDDEQYSRACVDLSNFTMHRLYQDYLANFEVRA